MRERARQMARVAAVRALRERLHEVASARAAAAVRVVDEELARVETARTVAAEERWQALAGGDRGAWVLVDSMQEVARCQQMRLEAARNSKVAAADERAGELQASRRQREQAETMLRRTLEAIDRVEERTAQAQSDDRFLARRAWSVGTRA